MGYFQHSHANWQDYAFRAEIERTCKWCGEKFVPCSPNQNRHSYTHFQEDGNACALEFELVHMTPRAYLRHVGMTKIEYIQNYGIAQYKMVVLRTPEK